jgi:hypothetical protein
VTAPVGAARRSAALGLAGAVVLGLVLAACGAAGDTPPPAAFTPPPRSSAAPAGSAVEEVPDSPVVGTVTSIDSTGLTKVKGFSLRTVAGEDLTFVIGTLENGDEFPPGHLTDHMAATAPIYVYFRVENGTLVAYRLEDAG